MSKFPFALSILLAAMTGAASAADHGFSPVVPGLLTSLDAAVQNTRDGGTVTDAFIENSFRTQGWLAYHSLRVTDSPSARDKVLDMDSFVRTEDLREKTYIQLGDVISQPNAFGRSARLTGLSFGRGMPVPTTLPYSYAGLASSAVVPSFVDIYLGQQLQRRQDVDSGALTLSMAGPAGFGDYEVVTKDVLGRKLLVTQKAAHGDRLTGAGALDYRVDVGGLRTQYAEADRHLDGTGGIARARYGLTSDITLAGHVAATPHATSLHLAPAARLGALGVASGFYEVTNRGDRLAGGAFERTGQSYTLGLEYARSTPGVEAFGYSSAMPAPVSRLTLRGALRVGPGHVNVMHVDNEDPRTGKSRLDFLGYTHPLSDSLHLMANFTRGAVAGLRTDTVYLNLIWRFDTRSHASVYAGTSGKETVNQVGAARLPAGPNDFGYELRHSNGSALDPFSQAKFIHHSDYARVEAQVNNTGSKQLRAKTTLAWTGEGVFINRSSSDAFVLADTGVAGATLQGPGGRQVTTNAEGKAMFPGVPANSEQQLTLTQEGERSQVVRVTAPRRGIVRATFGVKEAPTTEEKN